MSAFSAFMAMLVLLPFVLLLAWVEHTLDEDDYGGSYREPPKRNTWPSEDIDA